MKKLYTAEELSKYGENVVAVIIKNNEVYACGYIESNENEGYPEYENNKKKLYRFMSHGNNDHWKLDKNIYHGAFDSCNWLSEAIYEQQGHVAGDMYFHYDDPESWDEFESVHHAFVYQFGCDENNNPLESENCDVFNMFEMGNEEFSDLMDVLKNGIYIIAF